MENRNYIKNIIINNKDQLLLKVADYLLELFYHSFRKGGIYFLHTLKDEDIEKHVDMALNQLFSTSHVTSKADKKELLKAKNNFKQKMLLFLKSSHFEVGHLILSSS